MNKKQETETFTIDIIKILFFIKDKFIDFFKTFNN